MTILATKLFDARTALYTSVIAGTSLFDLWFAQEARHYSLLALLATASTFTLVWTLEATSFRRLGVYAVISVLMLYTHYAALFLLSTHGVIACISCVKQRTPIARWMLAFLAIACAGIPLLGLMNTQMERAAASLWLPRPGLVDLITLPVGLLTYRWPAGSLLMLLGAFAVTVVSLTMLDRRADLIVERDTPPPGSAALVLVLALLPAFISFAASHITTPSFLPKTMIVTAGAWYIIIGRAIALVNIGWVRTLVLGAVVALSVQFYPWYFGTHHKENWRRAATLLTKKVQPGDAIFFSAPHTRLALDHYLAREHSPPSATSKRVWMVAAQTHKEELEDIMRKEHEAGSKIGYQKTISGIEITLFVRPMSGER